MRALAGASPTSSAEVCGRWVGVSGALHHAPAADRGVRRHAFRDRETRRGRTDADDGRRLDERAASRSSARMLGGAASRTAFAPSAREMLAGAAVGGRSRKRKAKAKGRKRKSASRRERRQTRERVRHTMARKYLIETFGCQMNVHDSERMAGLLEQAGLRADRRRGGRRRRRHQHLQRPRARRREAVHAARRTAAARRRTRPRPDRRGRRLRRAAGRRRAS